MVGVTPDPGVPAGHGHPGNAGADDAGADDRGGADP
jgi:hypothetical protein